MLLFCDTETSGLFRDELAPNAPEQPHLVQLGAQLYDGNFRKRGHLSVLIKPDGWEIEAGAEAVHGISTATCHRYGVRLAEALVLFRGLTTSALQIIGHNVQFDRKVIELAIERAGGAGLWWSKLGRNMACTMEASTDLCQLPKPSGRPGYKFPKLEEAYAALIGGEMAAAHDADADIASTVLIYRKLVERGAIQPPTFGAAV